MSRSGEHKIGKAAFVSGSNEKLISDEKLILPPFLIDKSNESEEQKSDDDIDDISVESDGI